MVGIFRRKLGVAAGAGLVLYFVGAMLGHVRVGDWAGLTAPILPFVISVAVTLLGFSSLRRASPGRDRRG